MRKKWRNVSLLIATSIFKFFELVTVKILHLCRKKIKEYPPIIIVTVVGTDRWFFMVRPIYEKVLIRMSTHTLMGTLFSISLSSRRRVSKSAEFHSKFLSPYSNFHHWHASRWNQKLTKLLLQVFLVNNKKLIDRLQSQPYDNDRVNSCLEILFCPYRCGQKRRW